jgi:hypothetical protein
VLRSQNIHNIAKMQPTLQTGRVHAYYGDVRSA